MDIQREIERENQVVSDKLALIELEAEKIQKHMGVTARDIRRGRAELGSQESSFTGNKLRADYLLLSADELRLKWVELMRNRPYFCRIDWHEEGADAVSYYIGRVGMCRTDDYMPIVVDWRAPISNLYYDGRLGYAEYRAPDGTFTGDLALKRQLEIERAEVTNLTDIDITTNDNLLQAALSKNADDRLKEIVVTIQGEQNRIIRDKPEGVLIVQGVAGSGKTTILLHRVAYLIYHSEDGKGLKTLIIAPNRLFLNYISNVLPELGVEDIRQETFLGVLMGALPPKTKLLSAKDATDPDERLGIFKGSMDFKEIIDRYVAHLEDCMVPAGDFTVAGQVLMKHDEMVRMFRRDCQYLPLLKRPKEMEKRLRKRAHNLADRSVEAQVVKCDRMLAELRIQGALTTEEAHRIYGERDSFAARVEEETSTALKAYVKTWMADTTLNLYLRLLTNASLMRSLAPESVDLQIVDLVAANASSVLLPACRISEEDIAGLSYLESVIGAPKPPEAFDLIVIDEGQDLSELQYYMLRRATLAGSYTIAGDLNQAVTSRGVSRWEQLEDAVFPDLEVRYQTICKSYRTTVEIMELANQVISRLGDRVALADPVLRYGDKPEYRVAEALGDITLAIARRLPSLVSEGFRSVGIICRDAAEAKAVYSLIAPKVGKPLKGKIHLLQDTETEYNAGISVLPAAVAKGLEFDVTIVVDASRYELVPSDIRLFYVAATRALHRLLIHSVGPAPILEGIQEPQPLMEA